MFGLRKCRFEQLESLHRNVPRMNEDRWAVVTQGLAVNDDLKKQFGYETSGYVGLMSGTVFRIYVEEEEYYVAVAYGLLIPAYKYCVTLIERPLHSAHNYAYTSFGYVDSIDEMDMNCHRHPVVFHGLNGEAINIR